MSSLSAGKLNALEEAEIRSLLLRERHYKDTFQWEKLRACYHPDPAKTYIHVSWFSGDIDGFITGSQKTTPKGVLHFTTPVSISIQGSKAVAESLAIIYSRYEHDGIAYDLSAWVRGVSRLEQAGGEWKLLTLEPIYIRDNIVPVSPLTGPCTLDFSSVEHARPSYKYLTWLISLRGGKIRDDLPGEDDEESVKVIMERNEKWLAEE